MTDKRLISISKFISLVLRHKPESVGLSLDSGGWARVEDLVNAARAAGVELDPDLLRRIVADNDKQRFIFSDDGTRIRASQGHSIDVDLGLQAKVPPAILYHGTATRFFDSIRDHGLLKGHRRHVHLSADETTAAKVGGRHGKPAVLTIHTEPMVRAGFRFFLSVNGVWLTDHVPVVYIEFPVE